MKLIIRQGDVLEEQVDVLICTANPTLGMTGGVNGALYTRGGEGVQAELKEYLTARGITYVDAGSIVRTGPGPLGVNHILHAVGVNIFYESSVDLISRLLRTALSEASKLGARTVATPALATGYGPLTMEQFAASLSAIARETFLGIEELRVVLRRSDDVDKVRRIVEEGRASDSNS